MRRSILILFAFLALAAGPASAQTTGSISGTVTLFETAFEIRPSIQVYDASGNLRSSASFDRTPTVMTAATDTIPWTVSGLAPGTYYVRTSNPIQTGSAFSGTYSSGPWVDQLYGGGACVAADCDPLSGTPCAWSPAR